MAGKEKRCDILVAGAGYVGLATALAIKTARPALDVIVVDGAPEGVWQKDGRAMAIASAGARMLDRLGAWDDMLAEAQPIDEMVVTDSRTADPVRPVFLTFGGDAIPGEPFAHMVPSRAMNGALRARLAEAGVPVLQSMPLGGFETGPAHVTAHAADGTQFVTRLLVAADGARSRLRDAAGIKTVSWDYGQSGIVCTVAHELPHNGRAEEHFLPAGPFAILPLAGNRSSIVWTERTADADRLVREDPFIFETELEMRFGAHLGHITVEDTPRAFPLSLTLARDFVKPRFALAGDSAHGIHPIAGQGLNLGLRDAAALAEIVVEADRLGQDIGALDVLERYEQWRRFETFRMGVTTDVLNRMFSNDFGPLRALRDFGLGVVERLPALKNHFIKEASGTGESLPRLLKGEAI